MTKITKLIMAACSVLAIAGLSAQTANAQDKISLSAEWGSGRQAGYSIGPQDTDTIFNIDGSQTVSVTTTMTGEAFDRSSFSYAYDYVFYYYTTSFRNIVLDDSSSDHYVSTSGYVEVDGERFVEADWKNTKLTASSDAENKLVSVNTMFTHLKYHKLNKTKTYTVVINYKFVGVKSIGMRRVVKSNQFNTQYVTGQQTTIDGKLVSNLVGGRTYYVAPEYYLFQPSVAFEINVYNYNTKEKGDVENVKTSQQLNGYPSVFLYDVNTKKFVPVTTRNTSSSTPYAAVDADKNILTEDYPCLNDYGYYFTEAQPTSVEGVYGISFMPVDPTHTYIACVASRTAGYDMLVFTFDKNIETYHVRHSQFQSVVPMETDVDVTSVVKGLTRIRSSLYINASDVVTGIEDVDVEDANVEAVYYDLSGRSSSKPFNGVNIVKRGAQVTKELH